MIVTLTLNPSVDRSIDIDALTRGTVLRATASRLDPGGKGVNVTRALLANGIAGQAVLPCGGDEGRQLVGMLQAEGVAVVAVTVTGSTRSNVTLAEPDGTITKINESGATLRPEELDAVAAALIDTALRGGGTTWVAICGSLPPGVDAHFYGDLCTRLRGHGIRVAVDTSGPALRAAIDAGPDLVKPNRDELAEVVGRSLLRLGDVVEASEQVRAWGAGAVLASLGADGAVLVDGDGVIVGECPVVSRRSSVGAGDAMLAGFLAGGARGAGAMGEALAWGAAAVRLPGSRMPGPTDIHRAHVQLHPGPDLARALVAAD
jgi:1-phosphofructokinase